MAGQIQVFQKWLQEHGKICPQNMWSSADSVLICTEKEVKGSSSCQQLLKGHIKQHKSYICLTTMSSPLRGLEACFPCCTGECVPEGFAAKPLLNKTARSLRHGRLINHTHAFVEGLGGLYNHDVWILIENQESVPVPPPRQILVWDLAGEMCLCLWHLLWGSKEGPCSKELCLPPVIHQPGKCHGIVQDRWRQWGLELEFQSSLRSPFRNLSALCKCQQTLMKFHLCINLQNRKNASWTRM